MIGGEHVRRLNKAKAAIIQALEQRVSHPFFMRILHDEWCPFLNIGTPCDCNPRIELIIDRRQYRVTAGGAFEEIKPT